MEMIQNMIRPELLVLIPVLYFVGLGLKKSSAIADKHIPLILGGAGVALALIYVIATTPPDSGVEFLSSLFAGITQGILCAGCSVYVNQIVKQSKKEEMTK